MRSWDFFEEVIEEQKQNGTNPEDVECEGRTS